MKKYLVLSVIIVSGVFAFLIVITSSFFSNSESVIENKQRRSMLNACRVIENSINQNIVKNSLSKDKLLKIFSTSFSFEKVILVDSQMIVAGSSTGFITPGEDASPYILDKKLFKQALNSMNTKYSKRVMIDKVPFMAVYFPFQTDLDSYVIEISAGNTHFSQLEHLEKRIRIMLLILITIFILLIASLTFLSIKAGNAAQKAFEHEQMAFLGQTSAQLAHELKNPLAIIKSSADMIQSTYDEHGNDNCITYIKEETMHMSRIINQILSVSKNTRIENIEYAPLDTLMDIKNSILKSYPELEINIRIDSKIRFLYGPQAFRHIASNLMSNASKALQGKGRIDIEGKTGGKNFTLYFRDNGPGIDKKMASEIFKPFVSGSRKSTGLGLYIVRNLCSKLSWKIELVSSKRGCTEFRISMGGYSWKRC